MIEPRPAVKKIKPYIPPPEGRKGKLRLDFNENTLGCSAAVLKALKNFNAEDLSIYPEYGELRAMVASHCGVEPENILLTNGSDEALRYIFDAYLGRGEEIVIPAPTFAMIGVYASLRQARIKEVLYRRDLSFPGKKFINAISDSTKIVVLVNPNNPTGTEIAPRDVERIVSKASNSLVVIDEAYHQFLGHTATKMINEHPNVLVVQTLSKAYGLAGLRVGYITGNAEIIQVLNRVISPYSVNSVAVACAKAALKDTRYLKRYVRQVKDAKSYLREEMKKLGLKVHPSGANFFLVDFGKLAGFVSEGLRKSGILVRDRSRLPLLKGCIRIGIGTKKQCDSLLRALRPLLGRRAVLFDMDGVLIDASRSYRKAIKDTAEHFTGKKVTYAEIQAVKDEGNANNDWLVTKRVIEGKGGSAPLERIMRKFQSIYLGTRNKPGTMHNERWMLKRNVFEKLAASYKVALVTGRPRHEVDLSLNIWGFSDKFLTEVAMEDSGGKLKPDPCPLRTAMKKLHASEFAYVGDTIDDIDASLAAGCIPIGVVQSGMKGLASKKILADRGAVKVIDNINDLPEALAAIGFEGA